MTTNKASSSKPHPLISAGIWICIVTAAALIGWGGWLWWNADALVTADATKWGSFGSYLQGTTASVWSLAGLLIIFIAFLAQMRQLHLQQHQFERQSFESVFFQLVGLHIEIVSEMREVNRQKDYSKVERRECFKIWYDLFKRTFTTVDLAPGETEVQVSVDVSNKYRIFCFLDIFSGLVARDSELAGNKVEHRQQILSAAVSPSFPFGG